MCVCVCVCACVELVQLKIEQGKTLVAVTLLALNEHSHGSFPTNMPRLSSESEIDSERTGERDE